ncbi:uncharacterized protein [Littorina saxatilis]|uniref:Uncharacterized protein n=1 Tax=Littorina saxatilis TaxID=31220 RepID=A0AAN9GGI4_9CAEN
MFTMRFVAGLVVLVAVLACSRGQLSCVNYNPLVCLPDLKNYCLVNGTMMRGTCDAQAAICGSGAPEATDIACCLGTAQCTAFNSAASHGPVAILTLSAILFYSLSRFLSD